jgi:hypothetical protein
MKKQNIPVEFVYQLFALIIAIIIVHAFYVSVVRPNAAEVIAEQNILAEQNADYVRERSIWVLVKDLEQEACFVLMFWALAIMGFKAATVSKERKLLEVDLIPVPEGMRILPEDTREFARQVQALPAHDRRIGGGTARVRTRYDPLHLVGNPVDRVHRYRARYRRGPCAGGQGCQRRYRRRNHESGCGVQLDLYRAADLDLPDVSRASAAADAGTTRVRRGDVL